MINDIIKLYREGRELTLLEIAYFAITLLAFGVAGVVALFNQSLGVSILIVPLVSLIAGVMNIVAWSLVKLIIEHIIESKKAQKLASKEHAATGTAKSATAAKKSAKK